MRDNHDHTEPSPNRPSLVPVEEVIRWGASYVYRVTAPSERLVS